MPGSGIKFSQIAFVIERREPEDAVDRTGCHPILEKGGQRLCVWSTLDAQHIHSLLAEILRQSMSDAALVRHDHGSAVAIELYAGGLAKVERRTQDRDRHAARNSIRSIKAGKNWSSREVCGRGQGPCLCDFLHRCYRSERREP